MWSYDTAFSEWGLPAVAMTRIYAEKDGDKETAAREPECAVAGVDCVK